MGTTRKRRTPFRRRIWRIRCYVADLWLKMPWIPSEGEATARVVNMAFGGYPMLEGFESKEDAVNLLQSIWNIVENWDGSRINVEWAKGSKNVYEWARQKPASEGGAN